MLDDIKALKKIKEGNITVFEQLFKSYYIPLRLYAISIVGRTDIAEEIIQDLFYVLWRDRESIHILSSVKSYLYGAVRNRSLQYCERRALKNRHQENFVYAHQSIFVSNPQDGLEYKELELLIDNALKALPERRLKIFQMHRFNGLKYNEIAQHLSISIKTVEAEMSKTLKILRKTIENYSRQ